MGRVGKIHVHDPGVNREEAEYLDVYRCVCGKEFLAGKTDKENLPVWLSMDSTSQYVEYDVDDSPLIGRYAPEFAGVPREKKEPTPEELMVDVPGLEGNSEFSG